MNSNNLFSKLEEYYIKPDIGFSEDGIEIKMTLAPWGCSLKYSRNIGEANRSLLDGLNACDDFFFYVIDGNKLIAKTGFFVDGRPNKSSLKLLVDSGIARFKSAELLLTEAGK